MKKDHPFSADSDPEGPRAELESPRSDSGKTGPSARRRSYSPPKIATRPLFERLALSCQYAVDPDTGELIVDGPS